MSIYYLCLFKLKVKKIYLHCSSRKERDNFYNRDLMCRLLSQITSSFLDYVE